VAVTGTPGTGKSSVGAVLAGRGYHVVDLSAEAERLGLVVGTDPKRGAKEIDVEGLAKALRTPTKIAFVYAHFAHLVPSNAVVVLRCHPRELRRRLEARGWPPEKVRENVEAEAVDVVLVEAKERSNRVYVVDTTRLSPEETAQEVLGILMGDVQGHEPGSVDWSEEVLTWY
jgi:adenylate kinase